MGGADQIAKPLIGDVVETKFVAELQLAEYRCYPDGGDEPYAVLYAVRAALAEILGGGYGVLEQGWIIAATHLGGAKCGSAGGEKPGPP